MKKLCFVNYDMTVTGGVEQVTTTLANEFCKEYEVYIYAIFGKRCLFDGELSGNDSFTSAVFYKSKICIL